MQEYTSKVVFVEEIQKTARLYISEFADIEEKDRDLRLEDGEKTPYENLAYQLGWMNLIKTWEADELAGKEVVTPTPGIKWNKMGELHERFYAANKERSMQELQKMFGATVDEICLWIGGMDEKDLFQSGGRKWAASTASDWPVWKWVHINTVAPFKSFRSKIRKWKKLRVAN